METKHSFAKGFLEGLSKPFSLFGDYGEKPEGKPFEVKRTVIGGIASDWAKLGGDMRRAMDYVAANAK